MNPGRISHTAVNIAAKMYGLTRIGRYRSLSDDWTADYYERVVRRLPPPWHRTWPLLRRPGVRNLLWGLNETLLPGDMMHVLLRKRYISDWVGELAAEGKIQLLVPGAGFGHLPVRLSPDIPCIATDPPRMSAFRRKFLREEGYANEGLEIMDGWYPRRSFAELLHSSLLFPGTGTRLSWQRGCSPIWKRNRYGRCWRRLPPQYRTG